MDYINLMKNVEFGEPTSKEKICDAERKLNFVFPQDYKEFILNHNGAEGELGENSYISIWAVEEIYDLNTEYDVNEFTPGLIYFGSDGSDTIYAFDTRESTEKIVEFPAESIHIEDAEFISDSFGGFIKELYNR